VSYDEATVVAAHTLLGEVHPGNQLASLATHTAQHAHKSVDLEMLPVPAKKGVRVAKAICHMACAQAASNISLSL